jgi:hypothetical protein
MLLASVWLVHTGNGSLSADLRRLADGQGTRLGGLRFGGQPGGKRNRPPKELNDVLRLSIEELCSASYRKAKPRIEEAITEKEAELETLWDVFAGLSSKLKERGNRRGEALRSVVGETVRRFQDQRKRRRLVSIEVVDAEGGAAKPLTFPGVTLQSDTRLRVSA